MFLPQREEVTLKFSGYIGEADFLGVKMLISFSGWGGGVWGVLENANVNLG